MKGEVEMENYGFISLLPVLCILILAVTTKRTLAALLCGSIIGTIILKKGSFATEWISYFNKVMQDETVQWIIMVIALFGALIILFERSKAVTDFAVWLEKFVNSRKKSLFLTYILGIIIFLDDYLNNLVVGTTMKKLTDRYKVPRTLLAYVVNTTAAPVCILIPLSTWAVFFAALMEDQGVTVNGTGMGAYIQSIPYIFYGWISLIMVPLVIFGVIPMIGPMKKHNQLALETGQLFPEASRACQTTEENVAADETGRKSHPFNFLVPLIVMIIVTVITDIDILMGTMAALVVIFIMYLPQKIMTFGEMADAVYEGINSMLFVIVLTSLAFMVQKINLDLHLAEYIITVTKPLMHGAFLPAVVFIVCSIYAYATGCFWDLAAIITPIVIPLAISMNVDPILAAAAIFSGAAFGSNTCLYGDAVILASRSTEIEPVNLMLTTLPYAIIGGIISVILYIITGFVFY